MKSVVKWLNRELRYKVAAPIFIVSLALFASAVIPLLVTIDGIIYIANAKSILTPDFANIYTLYREPGYPLFLKGIHFWGDAGVLVVLTQSALLAAAGLIAFYSITRLMPEPQPRRWQLILLWVFLANPMFLGYSGTILQQALFTFQLAGFALLLSWAIQTPRQLPKWIIALLGVLWYVLGVATSIGWMYLALLPLTTTLFLLVLPSIIRWISKFTKKRILQLVIAALAIPIVLVATYAVGRQTYQAWDDYKQPYISQGKDDGYVIKPLETVPGIPTPSYIAIRVFSLMNMTVLEPYEKENDLFMGIQMRRQSPSSSWDSAWEVEPQASYALNYFVITNPGEIVHNGYARLAVVAPWWYQGSFVVMWLLGLGLLIARKWKPLSIVILAPINFLIVYAASNSPIDRYGVPTYAFAAVAVVISVTWIVRTITLRNGRNLPTLSY